MYVGVHTGKLKFGIRKIVCWMSWRLIHLLFTKIVLYYGAQKFLCWGLITEISVPHTVQKISVKSRWINLNMKSNSLNNNKLQSTWDNLNCFSFDFLSIKKSDFKKLTIIVFFQNVQHMAAPKHDVLSTTT